MKIWRISNHEDLSGIGGTYSSGRWNRLGTKIVYCSDHPSTCLLELLVRFDPDLTPSTYKMLEIEVPEKNEVLEVELSPNWHKKQKTTQKLWQDFCSDNQYPILKVPSVVMPQAFHYLLNPEHPNHGQNRIVKSYENFLDDRFYG